MKSYFDYYWCYWLSDFFVGFCRAQFKLEISVSYIFSSSFSLCVYPFLPNPSLEPWVLGLDPGLSTFLGPLSQSTIQVTADPVMERQRCLGQILFVNNLHAILPSEMCSLLKAKKSPSWWSIAFLFSGFSRVAQPYTCSRLQEGSLALVPFLTWSNLVSASFSDHHSEFLFCF